MPHAWRTVREITFQDLKKTDVFSTSDITRVLERCDALTSLELHVEHGMELMWVVNDRCKKLQRLSLSFRPDEDEDVSFCEIFAGNPGLRSIMIDCVPEHFWSSYQFLPESLEELNLKEPHFSFTSLVMVCILFSHHVIFNSQPIETFF